MLLHRPGGRFLEPMNRLINYFKDTRAELNHVSWPTTRQAIVSTALVIGISIIVAAFTGAFDYLFTTGLDWFLN